MISQLESLGKAEKAFEEMVRFVKNASESGELRIDEVERAVFNSRLVVGRHLLTGLVAVLTAVENGGSGRPKRTERIVVVSF